MKSSEVIQMFFKRVYWFLYFLVRPKFWMSNNPTNNLWDEKLNKLLDKFEIKRTGVYTCEINGIKIWISNYPYCYGSLYSIGTNNHLPKKRTRLRLFNCVLNAERQT